MIDDRCPRCRGLVAELYDDPHCLNCGWRRRPILPERNQRERTSKMTPQDYAERYRAYWREYWRKKVRA